MKAIKYGIAALVVFSHFALVFVPVDAQAQCTLKPTGTECVLTPRGSGTVCVATPQGTECTTR